MKQQWIWVAVAAVVAVVGYRWWQQRRQAQPAPAGGTQLQRQPVLVSAGASSGARFPGL